MSKRGRWLEGECRKEVSGLKLGVRLSRDHSAW